MKTTKLPFLLFIILFLALFVFSIPNAQLTNAQVSSSGNIIRICSNGTVVGTDKIQCSGGVCTLSEDLTSSVGSTGAFIFIECNNIVLDGAGHTIDGQGYGTGICMIRGVHGVTVENFNIINFETGITFWTVLNWPGDRLNYWNMPPASDNKFVNNNISVVKHSEFTFNADAGWAFNLGDASNTLISGNTIKSTDITKGIFLRETATSTLLNNQLVGCSLYLSQSSSKASGSNNTVDGKPMLILSGESNQIIDGTADIVFLVDCYNVTVKNVNPSADYPVSVMLAETNLSNVMDCGGHIFLMGSSNNSVSNNNPDSIQIEGGSYNKVYNNTINCGHLCFPLPVNYDNSAILLYGSSVNNSVYENIIANNSCGIELGALNAGESNGNDIYDNSIINASYGILGYYSSGNNIHQNYIGHCGEGMYLGDSTENIFSNYIENCSTGISLNGNGNSFFENYIKNCNLGAGICGSNNSFYRNNFVKNGNQVAIYNSYLFDSGIVMAYSTNNTFDLGYPSSGNYWSDYNGTDRNHDGTGDNPYTVYENCTDNYPAMSPFTIQAGPNSGNSTQGQVQTQTKQSIVILAAAIGVSAIAFSVGLIIYFKKRHQNLSA